MRVRAVAAPSTESNAVGPVELECTVQGLVVRYLGVGAYQTGYAPGAVTTGTQIAVPWPALLEAQLRADHLFLAFEPSVSPHHRLALVHFSDGTSGDATEQKRRRRLLRILGIAATLVVGVTVTLQLPNWSHRTDGIVTLLLGLGAAIGTLLASYIVEGIWLPEPRNEEQIQQQFVQDLRRFRPVSVGRAAGDLTVAPPLDWNELIARMPRSTLAVLISLTAAGLAFVLTTARFAAPPRTASPATQHPAAAPPGLVERAEYASKNEERALEPAAPVATGRDQAHSPPEASNPKTDVAGAVADSRGPCVCERADSVLWGAGFPRVSTLLIGQSSRQHKDHSHLEIDLAVVNNSQESIPEVNLIVQFFEDEGRKAMKERPLHYGSRLRPGQAVKWNVEARGTSFVVHNPMRELLDSSGAFAPVDSFAELLKANHRPVRLHGAMMLAFLGDARAKGGAIKLREALRESEQPYLDRVLLSQADVITCDWRASEEGRVRKVSACAYNQTAQVQKELALKVRGLDRAFDHRSPLAAPPQVIVEQTWDLSGELTPQSGMLLELEMDTSTVDGRVPVGFEFIVDRAELL